jgi:3',5'-cyclic AMP phosphodiesterase CpdA
MTRMLHVSDLHFGRADGLALNWFADAVAQERPDAVIVTGDLTMRARNHEFAAAAAWLAGLSVPMLIEPGNHDLPYFNPIARFFTPYRRFRALEAALERPLDLPGVWFVPLKTTARAQWRRNWSWGWVSEDSLAAALNRLRARPAGSVAVVTCHHPLVDTGAVRGKGRTRGGVDALGALAAAGADAVLSGHVHDAYDVEHPAGGRVVRLIGAGTLSERVRATRPSYNRLVVEDGRLTVEHQLMPV